MAEKGEANDRIAPQGVLRALIVTPTRELALQVLMITFSCCLLSSVLNSFLSSRGAPEIRLLETACSNCNFLNNIKVYALKCVPLLKVTDHLKEVALGTNIRVVPIVGGMSTEKQERLLKARPEIVVGTPGRLWELMSGGEIHLVEVRLNVF